MIFKPELAKLILRGRKTQTRRLIRQPHQARRANGTTYMTSPWTPTIGRHEPVQPGRGKPAICRVEITAVSRQPLADLTYTDARAEGFRTRDDFKAYWIRLHETAWVNRQDDDTDELLADRFDEHWASLTVWAVTFQLVPAPPVLLARAAAPTIRYRTVNRRQVIDDRDRDIVDAGYTTSPHDALADEPEVIDPAQLHRDWQQRAIVLQHAAAADADALRLTGLDHPDEQLRELRRLALERGIDITDDVRIIESRKAAIQRRLDEIDRKIRRTAA